MSESCLALLCPPAADPIVADDLISDVARGIAELQRLRGLQLAWEVGHLIVEKFYGGNPMVLRERGPKDASLRRLAEHPDLPMSPSALFRSVAIYEVAERTGGVATWKHLGPSHVRTVLVLEPAHQHQLLRQAEDGRWTVQRLEEEVRGSRGNSGRSGGRPLLPRFQKAIHALAKFVDGDGEVFGDLDRIAELDADEAQQLHKTVMAVRTKCEELEAEIHARVPAVSESRIPGIVGWKTVDKRR